MSPNYPNEAEVGSIYDPVAYSCNSGEAFYTVVITADFPSDCPFVMQADQQESIYIGGISLINQTYYFNATNLTTVFDGTNCSADRYNGFLVIVRGVYIVPRKNESIGPNWLVIILASSGGFILICITIITIAIACIRTRQNRYNKMYKLLKEMNLTPEEISEMKSKSDEMKIPHGKLHINFEVILGKGISSTVYKAHLIGPSPLHEQQKSEDTHKFMDCDVATKVSTNFGKIEVEQMFKEIDAMMKIGYHENALCMLGWSFLRDTPCLVFEMAETDLLHFVSKFQEEVPYAKFLNIFVQVVQGWFT